MTTTYAFQRYDAGRMARAYGRSLPISTKKSIELCSLLRNKPVAEATSILGDIAAKKQALRLTRFNKNTGHKKGIGPGRYPAKASDYLLKLLKSAEKNAVFKGLSAKDMIIGHITANKASSAWHYGRQRRRKMKRTHIEVVLVEAKGKPTAKKEPAHSGEGKKHD